MKRLLDLLRINEVRFTFIVLSVMTIAGAISLKGNLMSGGAVPCMYDIYLVGTLHMVSSYCVPFILFIYYSWKGITKDRCRLSVNAK